MDVILAAASCDPATDIICVPENVNELFELPFVGAFNRTILLMLLAAVIVVALLYFGLHKRSIMPTKFGTAIESLVTFVRDDIAIGIIGPNDGLKYFPYLLSLFLFLLVGNLFEITPFVNFPIASRIGIPIFLALLTWVIFVVAGLRKQGLAYIGHLLWPPGVPIALKPLVGLIEFVSTLFLRPITLAVRLFANMVAGHLMLTLLLVSGVVFVSNVGNIGARAIIGIPWFVFGLGIFLFEIVVAVLQAYIFTLLSAVYVQTSIHPEH